MLKCFNPYVRSTDAPGRNFDYSRKKRLRHTPFPCGKCEACKAKRKLEWSNRLYLEASQYKNKVLHVTLTYEDEHLPKDGNLSPKDFIDFMKRLRRSLEYHHDDIKVKYFCRGEYGPKTQRPHFHLILFGLGPEFEELILKSWKHGFIKVQLVEEKTCHYVAGYTTKKLEQKLPDHIKLREYQSQSGGIGSRYADNLALTLSRSPHYKGEPVTYVTKGKKKIGVGRYIRLRVGEKLKKLGRPYCEKKIRLLENIYIYYFKQFHGVDFYNRILEDCRKYARMFVTPKFKFKGA